MSDLERFGDSLAQGSGPKWRWWLAGGGGRQRTVVGAMGLELLGDPSLVRLAHEPGALERWLQRVGNEAEYPGMPPPSMLAQAEAEGGLSATGAWVAWGGLEILFVPVDLQSAGYDGSPRDRLRQLQARTLNRALAAALADRPGAATGRRGRSEPGRIRPPSRRAAGRPRGRGRQSPGGAGRAASGPLAGDVAGPGSTRPLLARSPGLRALPRRRAELGAGVHLRRGRPVGRGAEANRHSRIGFARLRPPPPCRRLFEAVRGLPRSGQRCCGYGHYKPWSTRPTASPGVVPRR